MTGRNELMIYQETRKVIVGHRNTGLTEDVRDFKLPLTLFDVARKGRSSNERSIEGKMALEEGFSLGLEVDCHDMRDRLDAFLQDGTIYRVAVNKRKAR